jgi:WD40 repeat protein
MFAAGSFSGTVSLYDADTSTAVNHLEGVDGGGVVQVAFHPFSPTTLFIGSRRSSHIQVYDTRHSLQPLAALPRAASTNQRIHFDIDPWGRYLATGDEGGIVKVWDIQDPECPVVFEEKLTAEAVGSVQLHPFKPLLLVSSGSRAAGVAAVIGGARGQAMWSSYDSETDESSSSSSGEDEDEDEAQTGNGVVERLPGHTLSKTPLSNAAIRIWSCTAEATTDTAHAATVDAS